MIARQVQQGQSWFSVICLTVPTKYQVPYHCKIPEATVMLSTGHMTTFNKQLLQWGHQGRVCKKPKMCSCLFKQTQTLFTICLCDNSTSTLWCGHSAQPAEGKSCGLLPLLHKPTKELTHELFKRCVTIKVPLCSCKPNISKGSSWDNLQWAGVCFSWTHNKLRAKFLNSNCVI